MRILWVGHNLAYPPVRGVLQRNYNLLREVAKNCEVHVVAFDQPATRPDGVSVQDCVRALSQFCAKVDWVPLSRQLTGANRYVLALRGMASREPLDILWLASHEMAATLRKTMETTSFDVVHFDTLGLAQYRPLVKNAVAVLNHHNVESAMMTRRASDERNVLAAQYYRLQVRKLHEAEKRWCPQFGMNLVVSGDEEQLLKASVPDVKTAVVANGVDTDYFTPRADPGGRTLLFCGGLDWYPNADAMKFFFDVIWPKLIKRLKDITIRVLGRRPPKWLRRLSTRDDRIHVPGFVEDVRPYFRKTTAYVCPITSGGGTRLKILDALAMGVPLIGTSFACSGLTLGDEEHVLLAETPEEFVFQIERVIRERDLRTALSTAGREIVEQVYSWNVIGKSLIRAYERASRGGSVRRA